MNEYYPKPLDVSGVQVSKEIEDLAEALAKNTHEVWSMGKIDEGWTFGENIDTEKKTHPSLIPYEELSESQKDYDRRTSMGALKFVLAMGFSIEKK